MQLASKPKKTADLMITFQPRLRLTREDKCKEESARTEKKAQPADQGLLRKQERTVQPKSEPSKNLIQSLGWHSRKDLTATLSYDTQLRP